MVRIREIARRSLLPSVAVTLFESRVADRVRTQIVRARKRPVRAEFYFAFDDPYSALAFRAVRSLPVDLSFFPIIRDPAEGELARMQRRYEVVDAARLARRFDLEIARKEPVPRGRVSELAAWAEVARQYEGLPDFCEAMLARIWRRQELPDYGEIYAYYQRTVGAPPPRAGMQGRAALRRNARRLRERGLWTSSSLWVEGKCFFAHERMDQVRDYCQSLGAS